MGKAKKEHRKKVAARNQKLKSDESAMQKYFNETMKKQLEEIKRQRDNEMSGNTTQN